MPYLGTQAAVGFSKTTKDRFSGDNSTTGFTMSQAANTGTDIQVFVDNIRQEPTVAYSTSGATLTFTEAPPTGTNNVYVIHQHQALGTGTLPPQDLGSTDYIFGDDISLQSDAAVINMGLDSEIKFTHVHNTGILLTDSGGSPTLQLHDSNESVSSDGSNLILTSGGTAYTLPTSDGTSGQFLKTDGSGALSFDTVSTSGSYDLNGEELILDADADTSITADTDDQIDIKVGGTDLVKITDDTLTLTSATSSRPGVVLESTNADANPPFLRFQKNGSSPADNDELAAIQFYADDDGGNVFVAGQIKVYSDDVTDGTEDSSITFTNINNGAANNCMQFNPTETVFNESSVDRDFRVETDSTANGFVVDGGQNGIGIGVSQKAYSDDSKVTMDFTGFTNGIFQNVNGTGSANFMEFNNGGGNRGEISTTGSNLVYSTSSDYRLKENVEDMTGAITRLKNLKPKRFSWVIDKKGSADTDGFLAHEVTDVVPDAVVHSKDETKVRKTTVKDADGNVLGNMSKDEWEAGKLSTTDENGKTIAPLYASDTTWVETETVPVYQSVDYSKLVTLLTGALQEAVARIETLETKVSTLEGG